MRSEVGLLGSQKRLASPPLPDDSKRVGVLPGEEEEQEGGSAELVVLEPVVHGLGDVVAALRAPALADAYYEFLRLFELAMEMVPGSVEDEHMLVP
jgi:hypothetical protein